MPIAACVSKSRITDYDELGFSAIFKGKVNQPRRFVKTIEIIILKILSTLNYKYLKNQNHKSA